MYVRVGGFTVAPFSFEMDVVLVGVALFYFHVCTC